MLGAVLLATAAALVSGEQNPSEFSGLTSRYAMDPEKIQYQQERAELASFQGLDFRDKGFYFEATEKRRAAKYLAVAEQLAGDFAQLTSERQAGTKGAAPRSVNAPGRGRAPGWKDELGHLAGRQFFAALKLGRGMLPPTSPPSTTCVHFHVHVISRRG